jgi:hypothetical protein
MVETAEHLVNAVAGVGSSFAQEFYVFLIFRFLSGVGSVKLWLKDSLVVLAQ